MPRFAVGHRFPVQTVHLAPDGVQQYLAAVGSESPSLPGGQYHRAAPGRRRVGACRAHRGHRPAARIRARHSGIHFHGYCAAQ